MKIKLVVLNGFLALIFVLLRTAFDPWMRSLSIWTGYGIEFGIVGLFFALNYSRIKNIFSLPKKYLLHVLLSIVLGVGLVVIGRVFHLPAPFNVYDPLFWLQLVVIAPLLEEALFRLMLWDFFRNFLKNPYLLILLTAILFSLSHFAAFRYVPAEFQGFVIYQTLYTLVLGLYWGWARWRSASWLAPVALHAILNFSFGVAQIFNRN